MGRLLKLILAVAFIIFFAGWGGCSATSSSGTLPPATIGNTPTAPNDEPPVTSNALNLQNPVMIIYSGKVSE